MTDLTTALQETGRSVRWQWLLALGVVLLLLGLAGAGVTAPLELTAVLVFAPLLLAGSILQLLTGFFEGKGPRCFLHYAAAWKRSSGSSSWRTRSLCSRAWPSRVPPS